MYGTAVGASQVGELMQSKCLVGVGPISNGLHLKKRRGGRGGLLTSNRSSAVKLLMSLTPRDLAALQKALMFSRCAKGIVDLFICAGHGEAM